MKKSFYLQMKNLQFFGNMTDQRFNEIKNMEIKDLYKLGREELQKASEMGETRAESVLKELELDELRKFKQEQEAEKLAVEQAEKIAEEIIKQNKELDSEIDEKINNMVEKKLQEQGVNLSNKHTRRLIEQKMHYDAMASKNVHVNGQYGREILSPAMKQFIHWTKTGEVANKAALVGTADPQGGYLVPEEFYNEVVRKMEGLAVVRKAGARVITMTRDKINVPVLATKGNGGWQGTAQGQTYNQSEPTFDEIELSPKKYDRMALASYEMLEDSAVNVADLLADIFAEDFALAEDNAFIAGAGTNDPEGIVTNANVALKTLAANTAIVTKDIFDLVYALKRQYRNGAAWFLHDQIIKKVRLLEDGSGQFIWSDGNLTTGEPARLAGYPVYPTDAAEVADFDGAGTGTGAGSPLIFGAPKYYYIADRQGFRLRRSTERYFEKGQVAFAADKRVDGKVALGEAFVKSDAQQH